MCMFVCMHACTYIVCMHACVMCVCLCVRVYIYIYVCMPFCIYPSIPICTSITYLVCHISNITKIYKNTKKAHVTTESLQVFCSETLSLQNWVLGCQQFSCRGIFLFPCPPSPIILPTNHSVLLVGLFIASAISANGNMYMIPSMAEILHHLGCMKPHYKWWDKIPINWCRISAINSMYVCQKCVWIIQWVCQSYPPISILIYISTKVFTEQLTLTSP